MVKILNYILNWRTIRRLQFQAGAMETYLLQLHYEIENVMSEAKRNVLRAECLYVERELELVYIEINSYGV